MNNVSEILPLALRCQDYEYKRKELPNESTVSPGILGRYAKEIQTNPLAPNITKRWAVIGYVESITINTIKIRDSRGDIKEAALVKDLGITDRKHNKVELKNIKVGDKILVTGNKNDKGQLTATKIRLQNQ